MLISRTACALKFASSSFCSSYTARMMLTSGSSVSPWYSRIALVILSISRLSSTEACAHTDHR